ncbi:MAG: phosphoribosylformylglycinamidine cyclo-ligase [Sandaracinaceae bacterium]
MGSSSYKDAGVDIEAGDRLVEGIKPLAAATRIPEVLGGVGGFAGLCRLPAGLEDPVLVSGTDGVGTKLRVAFLADRHDTVGIDLVAMCVNDIVTTGARPLFFLDYFATGRLDVERARRVVAGIAEGCRQAGCALLGGETAEMPGSYPEGEYDLAGFAVGVVERGALLDGGTIAAGDLLVGLPSSGLHANGFSLARRVLLGPAQDGAPALELAGTPPGLHRPLVDELLEPTRIYARAVAAAVAAGGVRGLCHVTGGGLVGNLPRILPADVAAEIDESSIPRPPVFDLIARRGGVAVDEMRRTFNLGVGLVIVVDPEAADRLRDALAKVGEAPFALGRIVPAAADDERVRYLP